MPTYAYACTQCDHRFDLAQSFNEDPLTICPECDGRLRKVYGSIGITFKGSGFYRTDSRASSRNGGGKPAESSSTNGSEGSSSGKDSAGSSTTSQTASASST